VQLTA